MEIKNNIQNFELRVLKGSIPFKVLAEQMDVTERTAINWFNRENLDPVRKERIVQAIEEIKEESKRGV